MFSREALPEKELLIIHTAYDMRRLLATIEFL